MGAAAAAACRLEVWAAGWPLSSCAGRGAAASGVQQTQGEGEESKGVTAAKLGKQLASGRPRACPLKSVPTLWGQVSPAVSREKFLFWAVPDLGGSGGCGLEASSWPGSLC